MITIDLTKRDCVLYKGCQFAKPARRRIPENSEENYFKLYRNMLDYFETIPKAERNELLVIGNAPYWIYALIFYVSNNFFKKLYYRNMGSKVTSLKIKTKLPDSLT